MYRDTITDCSDPQTTVQNVTLAGFGKGERELDQSGPAQNDKYAKKANVKSSLYVWHLWLWLESCFGIHYNRALSHPYSSCLSLMTRTVFWDIFQPGCNTKTLTKSTTSLSDLCRCVCVSLFCLELVISLFVSLFLSPFVDRFLYFVRSICLSFFFPVSISLSLSFSLSRCACRAECSLICLLFSVCLGLGSLDS